VFAILLFLRIDIDPSVDEQFDYVHMPSLSRSVQRRITFIIPIPGVDIRALEEVPL
jgi:hypothetical protein